MGFATAMQVAQHGGMLPRVPLDAGLLQALGLGGAMHLDDLRCADAQQGQQAQQQLGRCSWPGAGGTSGSGGAATHGVLPAGLQGLSLGGAPSHLLPAGEGAGRRL